MLIDIKACIVTVVVVIHQGICLTNKNNSNLNEGKTLGFSVKFKIV